MENKVVYLLNWWSKQDEYDLFSSLV